MLAQWMPSRLDFRTDLIQILAITLLVVTLFIIKSLKDSLLGSHYSYLACDLKKMNSKAPTACREEVG